MKIATSEQMRAIDRRAAQEYGLPGVVLMEAAGVAFARACVEELGGAADGRRMALFCGRGNNGGDGFVAARHLANAGANVTIFLAGSPTDLRGDAQTHFAPIPAMGIRVAAVTNPELLPEALDETFDLYGDALLGTGAKGAPKDAAAALIAFLLHAQRRGFPVVAADIPSGVEADTGKAEENTAVRATRTVTFALPKPGLLLYPGALHAGRVTVADVGIPRALLDTRNPDLRYELTTHDWMRHVLPPREQTRDANKGSFGTVLVIAGAAGMAGAATLTAIAALRAGAGLVMLAVPESLLDTAATLAPELVLKALPETPERTHGGPGALEIALALADKADAVAIGPGMGGGGNLSVASFVQPFVRRVGKPLVVDADGLNALVSSLTSVRYRGDLPTVLTPHPGEMGRLLQIETADVQEDRVGAVQRCANTFNAVTLLKGARTLIAAPDGTMGVSRRGTPALGTAGSGDVLTGVIGALLAQGLPAFDAARAGAYLHALAGEQAARDLGTVGVLATDIRDRLPQARQSLYHPENLDEL